MAREIAVFRQGDGLTADLGEAGTLAIFHRWQGGWKLVRETDFFLDASQGLRGLRQQLAMLLTFLGECQIFVAKAVTGVSYYELEKAGCSVWEYSGEPISYFEHIWAQEEKDALERAKEKLVEIIAPTEKAAGHFWISLKEIQAKQGGLTSKQVLMPFIAQKKFRILEIVCGHVPPWLEQELLSGRFESKTEPQTKNEIVLTIINSQFAN